MGEDEDKDEVKPEDQHMEHNGKDDEVEMWVRRRIRMRLSLRISIWRMMRKSMRMRYG